VYFKNRRIFLFISKKYLRAYLADGQTQELNRSNTNPICLLLEREVSTREELAQVLSFLCEYTPVNHMFYGFQESPSPSTVEFRRDVRIVFKQGHKLSYEFMLYKISNYYVALAQSFRVTTGYSMAIQDHTKALAWYNESLKWWPNVKALFGAAYLVMFDQDVPRNVDEGLAYLSEILSGNQRSRKFASPYLLAYYHERALEYVEHVKRIIR
jgi:hypothetical protein